MVVDARSLHPHHLSLQWTNPTLWWCAHCGVPLVTALATYWRTSVVYQAVESCSHGGAMAPHPHAQWEHCHFPAYSQIAHASAAAVTRDACPHWQTPVLLVLPARCQTQWEPRCVDSTVTRPWEWPRSRAVLLVARCRRGLPNWASLVCREHVSMEAGVTGNCLHWQRL